MRLAAGAREGGRLAPPTGTSPRTCSPGERQRRRNVAGIDVLASVSAMPQNAGGVARLLARFHERRPAESPSSAVEDVELCRRSGRGSQEGFDHRGRDMSDRFVLPSLRCGHAFVSRGPASALATRLDDVRVGSCASSAASRGSRCSLPAELGRDVPTRSSAGSCRRTESWREADPGAVASDVRWGAVSARARAEPRHVLDGPARPRTFNSHRRSSRAR